MKKRKILFCIDEAGKLSVKVKNREATQLVVSIKGFPIGVTFSSAMKGDILC